MPPRRNIKTKGLNKQEVDNKGSYGAKEEGGDFKDNKEAILAKQHEHIGRRATKSNVFLTHHSEFDPKSRALGSRDHIEDVDVPAKSVNREEISIHTNEEHNDVDDKTVRERKAVERLARKEREAEKAAKFARGQKVKMFLETVNKK